MKEIEKKLKKLGLENVEIKAIKKLYEELEKVLPGTEFKLFGSKVEGKGDEESDLDILILTPQSPSPQIRKTIIYKIFEINLEYETNISPLILSQKEWKEGFISYLPIHFFIEKYGVKL